MQYRGLDLHPENLLLELYLAHLFLPDIVYLHNRHGS